jgi:hypothetical protein
MDTKTTQFFIKENLLVCRTGKIKNLIPKSKSFEVAYDPNFRLSKSNKYANVYVQNIHPLLLARDLKAKQKMKPVFLHMIPAEFDGTNWSAFKSMREDFFNIRTNFCSTITNLYPIKSCIIYNSNLCILRDDGCNINPKVFTKLNFITASINNLNLDENNDIKSSESYLYLVELVESMFQSAIIAGNDVIILTDLCCKSHGLQVSDLVDIYNARIIKYCSMFKCIFISISIDDKEDELIYSYCHKNIIRPQEI